MSLASFHASSLVQGIHHIPRFGHSRSFARLASSPALATDYTDGILAFVLFWGIFVFLWSLILLILTYYYGLARVGCAAGGTVIDIRHLKKVARLSKRERKARILRNWRVQTACILSCLLLLPISIMMLRLGMDPLVTEGLDHDLRSINDAVDSRVYRGLQIVAQMQEAHQNVRERYRGVWFVNETSTSATGNDIAGSTNEDVTSVGGGFHFFNYTSAGKAQVTKKATTTTETPTTPTIVTADMDEPSVWHNLCPGAGTTTTNSRNITTTTPAVAQLLGFSPSRLEQEIKAGVAQMDVFIADAHLDDLHSALSHITEATAMVDRTLDKIIANDWILKLWVVVMDVTIFFVVIGVLVTKDGTDYPAYQRLATWCFVPLICLLVVASTLGAGACVAIAMINAGTERRVVRGILSLFVDLTRSLFFVGAGTDFCAGGSTLDSPIGTIRGMLELQGYDAGSLPFQTLEYYGADCLAANPLSFLSEMEFAVGDTQSEIANLYTTLNEKSLSTIFAACGPDNKILDANRTLHFLEQSIVEMRGSIHAAIQLTGCSSISAVLRRILFGATCRSSVRGLAWLFSTLMMLSILGLVIISTRAALYNPVIRGRRRKRREKEFKDYKEFMEKWGYDTTKWNVDFVPPVHDMDLEKSLSSGEGLSCLDSEDTRSTSEIGASESGDSIYSIDKDSLVKYAINHSVPVHSPHPLMADGESSEMLEVRMAAPIEGSAQNNDDDDDSYDSTYSSDDEANYSVGSSSIFSLRFLQRKLRTQQVGESRDELSNATSFSLLDKVRVGLGRNVGLGRDISIQSTGPHLQHSPYRLANADEHNDDDDGCDSVAGVMFTPPPMRYPLNLRRMRAQGRRRSTRHDEANSPEDLERIPLTPVAVEPAVQRVSKVRKGRSHRKSSLG